MTVACDLVPLDPVTRAVLPGDCTTPGIYSWAIAGLATLGVALIVAYFMLSYRKARLIRLSQGFAKQFDLLDEGLGSDFAVDTPPIEISFYNVSMTLKTSGKCVLKDVTGHFPAGSLVALMGPSGGGKTTFMNALLGRAAYGNVTGRVLINGVESSIGQIPSLVGFVPQDDIVHANLTVYENIYYNAMLRLPKRAPKIEKVKHCVQVLKALEIVMVKDLLVGDATKRGISGGQKKRVNIGMELVAMPSVIFMDEPTSGLDGAASLQLARAMTRLRESGLTMVCVIHQPRCAVFNAFSHTLLLGRGGSTIYNGLTHKIEEYMTGHGFQLPPQENTADWIIDIACGAIPRFLPNGNEDLNFEAPKSLFNMWATVEVDESGQSVWHKGYDVPPVLQGWQKSTVVPRVKIGRMKQAYYLTSRSLRQHNHTLLLLVCFGICMGTICFSYLQRSMSEYALIHLTQWVLGGFAFSLYTLLVACYFQPLIGVERLNYRRELASGFSSVGYWIAKNIHALFVLPLLAASFATAGYLVTPPQQSITNYYGTFLLAGWYWSGAAMMVTVATMDSFVCTLILIFWPIFEPVFEGQLQLSTSVRQLKYTSWFTCARWVKQSLLGAEYQQLPRNPDAFNNVTGMVIPGDALQFPAIAVMIDDRMLDKDDLRASQLWGLLMLFLLGLSFRMVMLLLLVYQKYFSAQPLLMLISPKLKLAFEHFRVLFFADDSNMHQDPDVLYQVGEESSLLMLAQAERSQEMRSMRYRRSTNLAENSGGSGLRSGYLAKSIKSVRSVRSPLNPNKEGAAGGAAGAAEGLFEVLKKARAAKGRGSSVVSHRVRQGSMPITGWQMVVKEMKLPEGTEGKLSGKDVEKAATPPALATIESGMQLPTPGGRGADVPQVTGPTSIPIAEAAEETGPWEGTLVAYLERRGGAYDTVKLHHLMAQVPAIKLRTEDESYWNAWLISRDVVTTNVQIGGAKPRWRNTLRMSRLRDADDGPSSGGSGNVKTAVASHAEI